MKKLILLSACLILQPVAALTWGELHAEIQAVESGNPANVNIIQRRSETVQSIVVYTRQLDQAADLQSLFCPIAGAHGSGPNCLHGAKSGAN